MPRTPTFAVTWRAGRTDPVAGRLELAPDGIALRNGKLRARIPYAQIASVRIGRGAGELVRGTRSVVLERRDGPPLYVAPLDGVGRATELADAVAARTRAG
jgi:hypothetical protein